MLEKQFLDLSIIHCNLIQRPHVSYTFPSVPNKLNLFTFNVSAVHSHSLKNRFHHKRQTPHPLLSLPPIIPCALLLCLPSLCAFHSLANRRLKGSERRKLEILWFHTERDPNFSFDICPKFGTCHSFLSAILRLKGNFVRTFLALERHFFAMWLRAKIRWSSKPQFQFSNNQLI